MKPKLVAAAIAAVLLAAGAADAGLVITGVIDGTLTGGTPKAIEVYATTDIADLGIYGLESANNGNPFSSAEYTFSGSVTAGTFLWIATESASFESFFGFGPTATSSVASNNGNDAIGLYENGVLIDVYGDPSDVSGSGDYSAAWAYDDSFAVRLPGRGPATSFDENDWFIPGGGALSNILDNSLGTVPFGTYEVPEPGTLLLLGLGLAGAGAAARRRRRQRAA